MLFCEWTFICHVEGTVTAQWLCVCRFLLYWKTLKWLLVSYHKNNSNLIKTKNGTRLNCFFFLLFFFFLLIQISVTIDKCTHEMDNLFLHLFELSKTGKAFKFLKTKEIIYYNLFLHNFISVAQILKLHP